MSNQRSSLLEQSLEIGGIPVAIVDPHHHVLPTWFEHFHGREPWRKMQLVHIDRHPDMQIVAVETPIIIPSKVNELDVFVKDQLFEGNFIIPAVHRDLFDSVYLFDPRDFFLREYLGDDELGTHHGLRRSNFRLTWTYGTKSDVRQSGLIPRWFTRKGATREIIANTRPIILDIDLDALECIKDFKDNIRFDWTYKRRFRKTFDFVEGLPRPHLITIARSQTPRCYVDPTKVDRFQEDVLQKLHELYE